MSLSALLQKSISVTSDDGGPWRQYVLDHLDWLKVRSQVFEFDDLVLNQYRYDLARLLREKEEFRSLVDMTWIVLLLNNMTTDMEFDKPGVYVIPTDELINQLYHSFITPDTN